MGNYYFDASAIVKRYAYESGTAWVRQLCSAQDSETHDRLHVVFLGEISRVEVAAALTQKAKRTKEITEQDADNAIKLFVNHLDVEYQIELLTSELIHSAAALAQRRALRAYDAVQLATALRTSHLLQENDLSLTFVSGDEQLVQAAQAEGLTTENPFDHGDLETAK